jgi:hypothetical protein
MAKKRRFIPASYVPKGFILRRRIEAIRDSWTDAERESRATGRKADPHVGTIETPVIRLKDLGQIA